MYVELPSATSRAHARAKAAYPWRFPPGQSGNPNGQSRFYHECRKIAREASPEMMRGLIELAKTAEDERVRSVCIVAVLDRAGVKPIDFDPDEEAKAMSGLSIAERKARLAELITRAQALISAPNTIEEASAAPSDEPEPQ
jgi:hypothetical protein